MLRNTHVNHVNPAKGREAQSASLSLPTEFVRGNKKATLREWLFVYRLLTGHIRYRETGVRKDFNSLLAYPINP